MVGQEGDKDNGGFVEGLETLRLLNLDDNCLEDWHEVMKLSKLPRCPQYKIHVWFQILALVLSHHHLRQAYCDKNIEVLVLKFK